MKETVQYPIRETERVCVCLCLCVCSLAHLNWQSWLQVTKRFGTFLGGWNRKAWESIIVNSCPHRDGWTLAVGVVPPPTQRGAATVHSGADAGNGGKFVSKITKSKRAQTLVLGSMLKKSRRRVWEKILELLVRCWMLLGSLKHNFLLRKPLKVLTAIQVKRLLSWQSCRFLWGFWGERKWNPAACSACYLGCGQLQLTCADLWLYVLHTLSRCSSFQALLSASSSRARWESAPTPRHAQSDTYIHVKIQRS